MHTVVNLHVGVIIPNGIVKGVVPRVCIMSSIMAFSVLVLLEYTLCTKSLEMFQSL